MTNVAMEVARMIDMLPEAEQDFALELVRKLVRAWDPDFTRVTPSEAKKIADAEASGFVDADDIDWDNLDKMDL